MTAPKIIIAIITNREFIEKSWQAAISQYYKNYSVIVHQLTPIKLHDDEMINKSKNCERNRTMLRKMLLTSNADAFLWIDMDVELPFRALEEFVKQPFDKFPVQGGWCKIQEGRWAACKYVDDNLIVCKTNPEPSLIRVDLIGMGCLFMTRDVLQQVDFNTEEYLETKDTYGNVLLLEEGANFCNKVTKLGHNIFMNGSVICTHKGMK